MPDARAEMALTLAEYGVPILILREGDKRPAYKGEFEAQATRDPLRIQRELGNGSNLNYGLAWGPVADMFALDVDAGGTETIASLEWRHGPLPPTWRIITQSGNYQDIFHWPHDGGPPIRNRGRFAPSLDVRGQGGQSVGPLSEYLDRSTGEVRPWAWAPGRAPWEIDLAEMPPEWLSLIRAHAEKPEPRPAKPAPLQARNRVEAFAASVMDAKLSALRTAPDGEQEQRLGHAALKAGSLIARGWISRRWCEEAIVDTLLACTNYRPHDPWTYTDAVYKVTRGIDNGERSPEPDPVWLSEIEERERPREHLRGIPGGKSNGSSTGAAEEPMPEREADPEPDWDQRQRPRPILSPHVWRKPEDIPVRQWLLGHDLMRGALTVDIGAPGTGKTQLGLEQGLSLASGKPLLGQACAPRRVGVINGEDPRDEIDRRVGAAIKHFGLTEADLEDRLFLGSGQERPFTLAYTGPRGAPEINEAMIKEVEGVIEEHKLDVLTLDPFVSFHRLQENDNMAIDLVAKRLARIAERCNMAMHVAHHPRKTNGEAITIDDSRGGGALTAAARIARLLNPMTEGEAEKAGLDPGAHRSRFRVEHGKANLAPPRLATWMRFIGVDLENGPPEAGPGDNVGVIVPWKWPNALAGVAARDVRRVQEAIKADQWKHDHQAGEDWAGKCIADTLGFDLDRAGKARARELIDIWIDSGLLAKAPLRDPLTRKMRPHVVVGEWIDPT